LWSGSYGSWIYNYLCNQCLSPLTLWVRILLRGGVFDITLCDKVYQWLVTGWWFSPGTPVSSINKTDCHDKTEILLKMELTIITLTPSFNHRFVFCIQAMLQWYHVKELCVTSMADRLLNQWTWRLVLVLYWENITSSDLTIQNKVCYVHCRLSKYEKI